MNIAAESKLLISFHSASQLCPEGKRELFYTHTHYSILRKLLLLTVYLQSLPLIGKTPEDKPWNNERAAKKKWPGAVDF